MNQLTEERVREIVREEMEKKAAGETTTTFNVSVSVNENIDTEKVATLLRGSLSANSNNLISK